MRYRIPLSSLLFFSALSSIHTLSTSKRSMISEDPCLDNKEVSAASVHIPSRLIDTDLGIREETKIFTSEGLRYQWSWTKSLPVRGLIPSTTVGDVISWFDSLNCSLLARGRGPLQSILRANPRELEVETGCSIEKLYKLCVSRYGSTACGLYPDDTQLEDSTTAHRLEIGDGRANTSIDEVRAQPLRVFKIGHAPSVHYTIEDMSILDDLAGHMYLIDKSGRGLVDACERQISTIGVGLKARNGYSTPLKNALKFYKLRWMGFSGNSALNEEVNKEISRGLTKKEAQSFYCQRLLGGVVSWAGESLTTACHLVYPQPSTIQMIENARDIMQHEMGDSWTLLLSPAVDELEAVYVTPKVFCDVRDTMMRRFNGVKSMEKKAQMVLGRPLVDDISEVHQRPILSKGESPSQILPRDYPSSHDHVIPDEHGGFHEQQYLPEGAGSDPMAYEAAVDEDMDFPTADSGIVPAEDGNDNNDVTKQDYGFSPTKEASQSVACSARLILRLFSIPTLSLAVFLV